MRGQRHELYMLDGTFFEWDTAKAAENVLKHGVTFEEAGSVFKDEHARVYGDPDHSDDESRFLLVGSSIPRRLLIIASVERGERIRLISARPVTRRERQDYEKEKG